MRTKRTIRLTTRDWIGDGIVTVVGGALLVLAALLPWANEQVAGRRVSYALDRPGDISGALGTPWGIPLLGAALVVIALGVAMIVLGPHRLALPSGIVVTLAGLVACVVALDAAHEALAWGYAAGLGIMLAMLVGILLVPIGVASATVGFLLRRRPPKPALPQG